MKNLKIISLLFLAAWPTAGALADPVVFSPVHPLFAPLLADPREPSVGVKAYTDERGYEASLGGTVDFFRWRAAPDMEWGLGIFAGVWLLSEDPGLTELESDDWFSGIYLSEKTGPFSLRFQFQDQKSNLGDALYHQESVTGFTRDNFNLALSLDALPGLRLYLGGGLRWPWDDFIKSQSQAFLFSGLEAESSPFALLGTACRAYGAYYFKYQDQAGGTYNHALQLGLRWDGTGSAGSSLRLALTYDAGHSEFGQFFQQLDQHMGIGIFYDP